MELTSQTIIRSKLTELRKERLAADKAYQTLVGRINQDMTDLLKGRHIRFASFSGGGNGYVDEVAVSEGAVCILLNDGVRYNAVPANTIEFM